MTNPLKKLLSNSRYARSWMIFLMDIIVSILCSLLAYMLTAYLFHNTILAGVLLRIGITSAIASTVAIYLSKTYRHIIRHSSLQNLLNIFVAVAIKIVPLFGFIILLLLKILSVNIVLLQLLLDGFLTVIALIATRVIIATAYNNLINVSDHKRCNILIYGHGSNSVALKNSLADNQSYSVVGFYDYGKEYHNYTIAGLSVFYFFDEQDFINLALKRNIDAILFPDPLSVQEEKERLIRYCDNQNIKILISPPVDEIGKSGISKSQIRNISIEDLLGREEININLDAVREKFKGKSILVTGAAGSIGSEIARQVAGLDIKQLILFDVAETPLHNLRLEMEERYPALNFVPVIGDVRVRERVKMIFDKYAPQIVFHAAAYKHVPLMEENPCEAILVNTIGTKMVADAAVESGVETMIMISTDKAVNPTNVMGATKRLAEIYVQSLGIALDNSVVSGKTKFITTRFGNVLGSNGSVIPLFRKQIQQGGPVTVTHPDIIRYFMTIPEACRLVMEAVTLGEGNDIFVFDMGEPVKIKDMAEQMIRLAGYTPNKDIKIKYTGLRPGEKLFEELLTDDENLIDTPHQKIKIAKVREYDYFTIVQELESLSQLSKKVKIEESVIRLKEVIPEYKSQNSRFEELDNKN